MSQRNPMGNSQKIESHKEEYDNDEEEYDNDLLDLSTEWSEDDEDAQAFYTESDTLKKRTRGKAKQNISQEHDTASVLGLPGEDPHEHYIIDVVDEDEDEALQDFIDKNQSAQALAHDVTSFGADVVDPLLYATLALNTAQSFHKALPTAVLNATGAGWNYFDGILGIVSGALQLKTLPRAKRRQKEKAAWAINDIVVGNLTNAAATLTLLAQYGVLQGAAATACAPLGGILFAAGTWIAAIRSTQKLARSIKKYNDPLYYFEDTIIRLENVNKKLDKLYTELDSQEHTPSEKEREKIELDIAFFESAKKQLEERAKTIYQVELREKDSKNLAHVGENNFSKKKQKKLDSLVEKLDSELQKDIVNFNVRSLQAPTETQIALMKELKKNQKENVISNTVSTIGWFTAAIGMTLIAVAPFAGPAAPAVMAAGIAISAVGGAIKIAQMLGPRIANYISKRSAKKDEFNNLKQAWSDKMNHLSLGALTDEDKIKYLIAFEQIKGPLMEKTQKNEEEAKELLFEELNNKSTKERNKLLDAHVNQYIDHKTVRDKLGLNENDPIPSALPNNQISQIANREYRSQLGVKIKQKLTAARQAIGGLFRPARDATQPDENTKLLGSRLIN